MSEPLPSAAQVRAFMEHWRNKLKEVAQGRSSSLEVRATHYADHDQPIKFRAYIEDVALFSEWGSPMAAIAEVVRELSPPSITARAAELRKQADVLEATAGAWRSEGGGHDVAVMERGAA